MKGNFTMRRFWTLVIPMAVLAAAVLGGGEKKGMSDAELDRFLAELHEFGLRNTMWNVSPEDGLYLRILAGSIGAKRVLELGTSNGYSGIHICRSLRETQGKLVTIELSERRAALAKENFAKAGVSDIVEQIVGDASKEISKLSGTFDMIFLDTEKPDYLEQFDLAFPLLRKGGVFIAHNTKDYGSQMSDFLQRIKTHPELVTVLLETSPAGYSVSYRKR
jgi:predicted O-methyltransferase YrrM